MLFKYERLPNFCYRCGLLEHDLKDCTRKDGVDDNGDTGELQYGAWMRGEPARRVGWELTYLKRNEGMSMRGSLPEGNSQALKVQTSRKEVETDKGASVAPFLGEKKLECTSQTQGDSDGRKEIYHEMGLVNSNDVIPKTSNAILVKESVGEADLNSEADVSEQGVMETFQGDVPKFKFEVVRKEKELGNDSGLELYKEEEGPIAMTYDMDQGWVAEVLGPTSGHWKRKTREGQPNGKAKELSPVKKKRNALASLTKSIQKKRETKKQRVEAQGRNESEDKAIRDGGEAEATMQLRRAK